jgi:hypothetical protein
MSCSFGSSRLLLLLAMPPRAGYCGVQFQGVAGDREYIVCTKVQVCHRCAIISAENDYDRTLVAMADRFEEVSPNPMLKSMLAQHDVEPLPCKHPECLSNSVRLGNPPTGMAQHGLNVAGVDVSITDNEHGDFLICHPILLLQSCLHATGRELFASYTPNE